MYWVHSASVHIYIDQLMTTEVTIMLATFTFPAHSPRTQFMVGQTGSLGQCIYCAPM